MTLIEVMTAMACLALVSVSLVGGLAFASERLRMAEERGLVANRLRQIMEDLKANPSRSPSLSLTTSTTETVAGVSDSVAVSTKLAVVSGRPGLHELWCQATWNARIGEASKPQTMTLQTFVLRDPPIPKITANLVVKCSNSYLHLDDATAPKPVIVDLLAYGFTEGTQVDIRTVGTYNYNSTTTSNSIAAVFSRTNLILGKGEATLSRVPDAIETGTDINTASLGAGVDIPQDFLVGATATRVTVPAGARYLALGVWDSIADSSGSLQVEVAPV